MADPKETALLVLGLGNVLLTDDGLGIAALERLERRWRAPDGVELCDGGTLGLALLDRVTRAEAAILVDAVRAPGPPGTPVRLSGDEATLAVGARLSPHQVGVADLLHAARWLGAHPRRLVLLGLVPGSLALGVGCTPAVEAGLDALVDRIAEECRALGHPLTRDEH